MSMLRPAFACAAIALASLSFVSATAGCDRHRRPRHPPSTQPEMLDDAHGLRTEDGGESSGDAGPASPLLTPQPGDVYL